MLLFFWIGLSSVLLGRILLSYLHLRGLRNRARQASADIVLRFEQHLRQSRTSSDAQLLVSDEVISPLVAGFLHPVIILPDLLLREISEPELDYILLHELAHVVRRDNWTNLMGRLVSAAFIFHPVAAWVLHRIEREREIACDDWVVAATGSAFRYAATLARMFEFCCRQRRELLATGMAHRSSNVRERIEILLRPRLHFSPRASLSRVSFCIAAGLALLSFGLRMPGWIAFAKSSDAVVGHTGLCARANLRCTHGARARNGDDCSGHTRQRSPQQTARNPLPPQRCQPMRTRPGGMNGSSRVTTPIRARCSSP